MARGAAVKLADGVWRIPTTPGNMINSFAVAGPDGGLTVVDAGLGARACRVRLVAGLAEIGAGPEDVRNIVISHAHPDHTGGLAALVKLTGGAGVLAHEREAIYLADGRSPRTSRGTTRSFAKAPATYAFPDGADLPGGLLAVHTPGHSPGHTALLHQESGVLFPGDAVVNVRGVRYAPDFLCTDPDRNRESADRLGDLDFETVAFAHGRELRRDARTALRGLLRGQP